MKARSKFIVGISGTIFVVVVVVVVVFYKLIDLWGEISSEDWEIDF